MLKVILAVDAAIIIGCAGCGLLKVSKIKKLEQEVESSYAGILLAVNRRREVINLSVATVREAATVEMEMLKEIEGSKLNSLLEIVGECQKLNNVENQLVKATKFNPEIKSMENYLHLQKVIANSNEHLSAAIRLYNKNVERFNKEIGSFLGSYISEKMDLEKKEYLM